MVPNVLYFYVIVNEQKLPKSLKEQRHNGADKYFITAFWDDSVLLPLKKRTLLIPRAVKGGIGQSNVWYANTPESPVHVTKVRDLINGFT